MIESAVDRRLLVTILNVTTAMTAIATAREASASRNFLTATLCSASPKKLSPPPPWPLISQGSRPTVDRSRDQGPVPGILVVTRCECAVLAISVDRRVSAEKLPRRVKCRAGPPCQRTDVLVAIRRYACTGSGRTKLIASGHRTPAGQAETSTRGIPLAAAPSGDSADVMRLKEFPHTWLPRTG